MLKILVKCELYEHVAVESAVTIEGVFLQYAHRNGVGLMFDDVHVNINTEGRGTVELGFELDAGEAIANAMLAEIAHQRKTP